MKNAYNLPLKKLQACEKPNEKSTVNVNVKTSLIKLVRLYFPEFATMPATHVVDGALRICVTYLTVAKIAETPKK